MVGNPGQYPPKRRRSTTRIQESFWHIPLPAAVHLPSQAPRVSLDLVSVRLDDLVDSGGNFALSDRVILALR